MLYASASFFFRGLGVVFRIVFLWGAFAVSVLSYMWYDIDGGFVRRFAMEHFYDGYRTDILVGFPLQGSVFDEGKPSNLCVSCKGRMDVDAVVGLAVLDTQVNSLYFAGGSSLMGKNMAKSVYDFASAHDLSCEVLSARETERFMDIRRWRTAQRTVDNVADLEMGAVMLGNDRVIAVCCRKDRFRSANLVLDGYTEEFEDFFADMLRKKRYPSEVYKDKEYMDKVNGMLRGLNYDLHGKFSIMLMTKDEYKRESLYVSEARKYRDSLVKDREDARNGLLKGDRYVLYMVDNADARRVVSVRESQIREADSFESAVSWYDYGRSSLYSVFASRDVQGNDSLELKTGWTCYDGGPSSVHPKVLHPKEVLKSLDDVFYRNWEKTLEAVVKSKGVDAKEYMEKKMFREDIKNGVFHNRIPSGLRNKKGRSVDGLELGGK